MFFFSFFSLVVILLISNQTMRLPRTTPPPQHQLDPSDCTLSLGSQVTKIAAKYEYHDGPHTHTPGTLDGSPRHHTTYVASNNSVRGSRCVSSPWCVFFLLLFLYCTNNYLRLDYTYYVTTTPGPTTSKRAQDSDAGTHFFAFFYGVLLVFIYTYGHYTTILAPMSTAVGLETRQTPS